MGEFELSPIAVADLEDIYAFGLDRFGEVQAERYQVALFDCFQLLADFPGIAGKPIAIKRCEFFRFPYGSHVIVFVTTTARIRIVAILGASIDWHRLVARRMR